MQLTSTRRLGVTRIAGAAVGAELGGLALAAALAVIAVAHILSADRAAILLSDGDSVLFELVHRSIRDGLPFHWVMSAVLFVSPEAPVYLLIRSVSVNPQQAIIVNAVLNLVVLYALVRAVAAIIRTTAARGIVAALAGYSAIVLCILLETTASRQSFELASLLLVGTYYYGTILAGFATVALVALLLSKAVPSGAAASTAARPVRTIPASIGLVAIALLCTASNPLFGLWVAAPVAVALGVVALLTSMRWGTAIRITSLLAVGTVAGLLARVPLAPFFSPAALPYIHPDRRLYALLFYPKRLLELALTPLGAVEVLVVVLLVAAAVAALVVSLLRRDRPVHLFLAVVGTGTPIIVYLANVVLGTEAERYLQPLFFSPVLSLVVLASLLLERRAIEPARPVGCRPPIAAVVIAAVVIVGVAVVPSGLAIARVVGTDYARVECLENWIDGRDVTGAGLFWDIRDLEAYGDDSVDLLQIVGTLAAFPWLIDLAGFYDADPSYLIVQDRSWLAEIEQTLGEPAEITDCPTYLIVDYAGTPGAAILAETVSRTGTDVAIQNGFVTP